MKKKLGALLLVLSAILIIPIAAHAAEIIDSGACGAEGDNVTWTLDAEGTLTISGTGEMNNYGGINGDLTPWYDNTENITKVVIEDGVTNVGEEAFLFCSNLRRAELPESVTYIGNSAFSACKNLTDITIPSGVASIGEFVFDGCGSLQSINIPESITSIGTGAFNGCKRLIEIKIPRSVTSIGEFAFGSCGHLDISVDADNPNYSSFGGVLFNKDKTKLLGYARDKIQSEYTVPDGVESIGMDAFYGCSFLTITIPKGVNNIERAFSYCKYLNITVDADNPNYSSVDGVLFNKDKTELIAYAKDGIQYTVPDSVTSICADAFAYCENLKNIIMKNSVTNIGDHAFYYCTALTNIVIPNSVISIGDSAFYYCTDLISITIPKSITSIGDGAFNYCADLTDIYYSGSEEDWKKINIGSGNESLTNASMHYNTADNIVDRGNCGANITWILEDNGTLTISGSGKMNDYEGINGDMAPWYYERESVTKVIVEGGVTSIGEYAFYECTELQETVFTDGIMSIGWEAFGECTNLSRVTIPESVTSINWGAFKGCTNLLRVTIPKNVTNIDFGAFAGCGNLDITVDANNPNYSSANGVLFNKDKTELIAYAKDKKQPQYTVPNSVTSIGNRAFNWCTGLTSVIIPNSVTSIGNSAFEYCTDLSEIIIPDGVTILNGYIFSNCTRLTSITIPDSVTSIDYYAFSNCSSLVNINISDNVSAIGSGVFDGCGNLNITVGTNNPYYSSIDGVLFNKDKTILLRYAKDKIQHEYSVPTGVTSIGDHAFDWCTGLTSVIIPNSVTSIGEIAFRSCESLTDIYYGGSKTEWQNAIGEGDRFLTDAVIHYNSDGISPDSGECGAGGANLTWTLDSEGTLTISGTGDMKDFGYDNYPSWYDLKKRIKKVIIEAGVTSIGDDAFDYCGNLTSVNISSGVTSIGYDAFADCRNLTSINIPDSVTNINSCAFSTCGSLNIEVSPQNNTYSSIDGVLFNKDQTQILAYSKDTIQTAYTIPDSVTSIGNSAFSHCGSLTNINIPDSVTNIGGDAFRYCSSLANINIPDSVTSIGDDAFLYTKYYDIADNWSEGVLYIGNFLIRANSKQISDIYNIKNGTKCIADGAFFYCRELKCVTIPDSVTSIGDEAFGYCSSLTSIIIPNGVKSIGDYTFEQCRKLTNATIPSSVISIGDYAFDFCDYLKDIYYSGNREQWDNIVIGENNDCLTGAEIHFNEIYFSNGKIEGLVDFDLNKNTIGVSTSLDNLAVEEKEKSEVFVVLYDENDVVIDSYNAVYDGAEISGALKNDAKADHIKVFVWNKDGSLEPITEAPEYIRINNN